MTPEAFNQLFPMLHFPGNGIDALLTVLKPITLAANDPLVLQGNRSDTLYFICSGRLQVSFKADDIRLVLGELPPGRWVCEFGFIDPGPAAADVIAQQNCDVLALSQESMNDLYKASPNTASALLQVLSLDLAERLRATSRQTLEKNTTNQYTLRQPEHQIDDNWVNRIFRRLFGFTGNE